MSVSYQESEEKYTALTEYLKELGHAAVAFSGGVDSSFLLKAAKETLGEKAVAITVKSVLLPVREYEETVRFCREQDIRQIICSYDALSADGFAANTKERCYLCKRAFFMKIKELAEEQGIRYVLEGSNMDDEADYRPGMRAVRELGVVSPLRKFGFTKTIIRQMAKEWGLSVWEKPSSACLASRIAYGERITGEKLSMIEKSEDYLHQAGFSQVRVRMHNSDSSHNSDGSHSSLARIEVLPEQIAELLRQREQISDELQKYGFTYVSVDLKGYRTGSMNEAD